MCAAQIYYLPVLSPELKQKLKRKEIKTQEKDQKSRFRQNENAGLTQEDQQDIQKKNEKKTV